MKRTIKVSAPGKVILSGEHSVVYGHPAILATIDRRITIQITANHKGSVNNYLNKLEKLKLTELLRALSQDFQVSVDSGLPIGCGLGSSAAISAILAGSFMKLSGQRWNRKQINEITYQMEKKHHGNPSGADNTIVTFGGFHWYRKEAENLKLFTPIKTKKTLPRLLLINSGKPKESTKQMVQLVSESVRKQPKKTTNILSNIGKITNSFLRLLLSEKSPPLTTLIIQNQKLLEDLSVVSNQTARLIRQIENLGGAAKVTGAGGKSNGSGMLLAYHRHPQQLINFTKNMKLDTYNVKLGEEGVKIER